jgi:hypothetical protein
LKNKNKNMDESHSVEVITHLRRLQSIDLDQCSVNAARSRLKQILPPSVPALSSSTRNLAEVLNDFDARVLLYHPSRDFPSFTSNRNYDGYSFEMEGVTSTLTVQARGPEVITAQIAESALKHEHRHSSFLPPKNDRVAVTLQVHINPRPADLDFIKSRIRCISELRENERDRFVMFFKNADKPLTLEHFDRMKEADRKVDEYDAQLKDLNIQRSDMISRLFMLERTKLEKISQHLIEYIYANLNLRASENKTIHVHPRMSIQGLSAMSSALEATLAFLSNVVEFDLRNISPTLDHMPQFFSRILSFENEDERYANRLLHSSQSSLSSQNDQAEAN